MGCLTGAELTRASTIADFKIEGVALWAAPVVRVIPQTQTRRPTYGPNFTHVTKDVERKSRWRRADQKHNVREAHRVPRRSEPTEKCLQAGTGPHNVPKKKGRWGTAVPPP